ncbi:MAG: deoxyribose-phosphate aldolase [Acidobacteriaceae bacterium]|nr:deoxyribose-phosphate aldolase [Acidobacteriaceae bacterium]MBV9778339.1 deoxyribose-phosphate aldolase [Acidobacteriaceae bacterium]
MHFADKLDQPQVIASLIDHTLLKPDATQSDIARLCNEAREFRFASVCVNPHWVRFALESLAGSDVRLCTVVGFPLGANEISTKIVETNRALTQGASEIDMIQNIGALRSGDVQLVETEIATLAQLAHSSGAILKVILETCLLSEEEIITACQLAGRAKADFVKTSTGFSTGGATVENVKLMRRIVGSSMGVKASGGIRTLDTIRQMVEAGANRIGTSSGVSILNALAGIQPSHPLTPLTAARIPGGDPTIY